MAMAFLAVLFMTNPHKARLAIPPGSRPALLLVYFLSFNASLSSSVGWFGRAMAILIVKETGWLEKPTETTSSTQMLTQVSPGSGGRALSFSTDDSVTLESSRIVTKC